MNENEERDFDDLSFDEQVQRCYELCRQHGFPENAFGIRDLRKKFEAEGVDENGR